jgi:hypothetical protein
MSFSPVLGGVPTSQVFRISQPGNSLALPFDLGPGSCVPVAWNHRPLSGMGAYRLSSASGRPPTRRRTLFRHCPSLNRCRRSRRPDGASAAVVVWDLAEEALEEQADGSGEGVGFVFERGARMFGKYVITTESDRLDQHSGWWQRC